jgi:DNA polymerase/3'-5' exonuclease PolX
MLLSTLLIRLNNIKDVKIKNKHKLKNPETLRFIIQAYDKLIKKLNIKFKPNTKLTKSKIYKLPITTNMKEKLTNLINETDFTINQSTFLKTQLVSISGIGSTKADQLIKDGLIKISQLKLEKWNRRLTKETQLVLKYNPVRKIPRMIIRTLEKTLVSFGNNKDIKIILVGSYRRRVQFSTDIDVMVVSNKKDILIQYINFLKTAPKINNIFVYSDGIDRMSFLIETLINGSSTYYKIDAFRTSHANYIPMLLYSTGSKEFNIKMRSHASNHGFLLNQKGLFYRGTNKKVPIKTEKDIFDKIGLKFTPVVKRI